MPRYEHVVIGAGLSGLMMSHLLGEDTLVIEAAKEINANLQAPFFLHKPIEWLPSRWKEITVIQNAWDGKQFFREPNIKVMNDYSLKISRGKIMTNSMIFMDGNQQRGFIPSSGEAGQILADLLKKMRADLRLGARVIDINTASKSMLLEGGEMIEYGHLISTIALPQLLSLLDIETKENFQAVPIRMDIYKVPDGGASEAYQVIYITDPVSAPNKMALMHQTIFAESVEQMDQAQNRSLIEYFWGFKEPVYIGERLIKPGKFYPIEQAMRKALLGQLTAKYDIYSLGRYATWSYKRMDHIAEDAQQIINIIKAKEIA